MRLVESNETHCIPVGVAVVVVDMASMFKVRTKKGKKLSVDFRDFSSSFEFYKVHESLVRHTSNASYFFLILEN